MHLTSYPNASKLLVHLTLLKHSKQQSNSHGQLTLHVPAKNDLTCGALYARVGPGLGLVLPWVTTSACQIAIGEPIILLRECWRHSCLTQVCLVPARLARTTCAGVRTGKHPPWTRVAAVRLARAVLPAEAPRARTCPPGRGIQPACAVRTGHCARILHHLANGAEEAGGAGVGSSVLPRRACGALLLWRC